MMKEAGNIYLVGFMGTGKSAVAQLLAKDLGRPFVDMDELIEKREKRKISDIFAREGEAYFRKIEEQLLREVSACGESVVSCGGGIVLDGENVKRMKQTGVMICLTARPEVILKRTGASNHRPLLDVNNPTQRIEELLKLRAPFYAKADYTIDSSGIEISRVVDIIIRDILPNVRAG